MRAKGTGTPYIIYTHAQQEGKKILKKNKGD